MEGNQSALTSTRSLFQLLNYRNGLEELLLMYWWVILLGNLVLFAFAKHSLMCWELHRDRRRLECCHMRHCQRRRAARQSKSVTACRSHRTLTEEAANTTGNAPAATSSSSKDPTEAGAAAKHAVDYVSKSEKKIWFPLLVPIVPTPNKFASPPRTAELMAKAALCRNRSEQQETTATVHQNDTRPPSLLLPLPSATSSALSLSSPLSTAQASTSATTRLLNRLGFMSPDLKQTNDERFDTSRCSNSSNASSRLSNCCPRYSADEQRLIDKKRQENVRAWMEAKRALELTESLAAGSCGVIPLSSVKAREFQPCGKGAIETELVS